MHPRPFDALEEHTHLGRDVDRLPIGAQAAHRLAKVGQEGLADALGALGSLALMLGLGVAGRMLGWSRPLVVFASGMLLLALGKVGFTWYAPGLTEVGAVWPAVVSSVGFGVITAVLATLAFRSLAPAQVGAASGLFVLSQQLGYALGLAMLDAYLQERTVALRGRALDALMALVADIKQAKAAGATDAQLAAARNAQRRGQFYVDFVESENSNGFHAPQEAMRVLGNAIDILREGQLSLRPLPQAQAAPAAAPAAPAG